MLSSLPAKLEEQGLHTIFNTLSLVPFLTLFILEKESQRPIPPLNRLRDGAASAPAVDLVNPG